MKIKIGSDSSCILNFNLAQFYLVEVKMRLSLAVSLLAVFTGHMTEAKGGRGKKGTVQNKSIKANST